VVNREGALSDIRIDPFLKWAGGKRWLTSSHTHLFPTRYNRYIEPFLGGGAVFFSLQPSQGVLSDINSDLIETYQAIKNNPIKVEALLRKHQANHSREYYYIIRNSAPSSMFARAAKFIYLNRTCWNGLYRVNLKGKFNVPIGTKSKVIMKSDDFQKVSSILNNVEIRVADFEDTVNMAGLDDVVFVDPPYTVKHNNNNFIKYNECLFSWDDQVRLKAALIRAKDRGAYIVLTNANHQCIRELYVDEFQIDVAPRCSVISGKNKGRGPATELVIRSCQWNG